MQRKVATAVADDSSSDSKDSVIFKKPFKGYAETLRSSVVVTQSGVTESLPVTALSIWRPSKADAVSFRGRSGISRPRTG